MKIKVQGVKLISRVIRRGSNNFFQHKQSFPHKTTRKYEIFDTFIVLLNCELSFEGVGGQSLFFLTRSENNINKLHTNMMKKVSLQCN